MSPKGCDVVCVSHVFLVYVWEFVDTGMGAVPRGDVSTPTTEKQKLHPTHPPINKLWMTGIIFNVYLLS